MRFCAKKYMLLIVSVIVILITTIEISSCGSSIVKASKPYMSFYECYNYGHPVVNIDFTNTTDNYVIVKDLSCEYKGESGSTTKTLYLDPYETQTFRFIFTKLPFEWDGVSDDMSNSYSNIGKITWTAEILDKR